jgi:hypothetical protein
MSSVTPEFFETATKEDHSNDPALDVDGLVDFWPSQTALDMESALAVSTLGDLFPGRDADAFAGRDADDDAIEYLGIAHDAPAIPRELLAEPCEPKETPVDDELCELNQVFESGHIFQSDIQRAASEFQRFAEKFHAFAAECQDRLT